MEGILYIILAILLLGLVRILTVFLHELTHAIFALNYTQREVIELFVGSTGEQRKGLRLRLGKRLYAYILPMPWKPYCGLCKYPQKTLDWQDEVKLLLAGNITSLGIFILFTIFISMTTHGFLGLLCSYFLICSLIDLITNLISKKSSFTLYDSTLQRTDIDQIHSLLTYHDLSLSQATKQLFRSKEKIVQKEKERTRKPKQEGKPNPTVKGNRMSDN